MELTIQRIDGTLYNLADYGMQTLDFQVDAPVPRIQSEEIDGRDGLIVTDATYEGRSMRASFYVRVEEGGEFALRRNEIYRMFASREAFYVIDSREPNKRWLVRSNGFSIDQLASNKGRFNIEFTSPSVYAESMLTTLDPSVAAAQFTNYGSRLVAYTHTTSTFEIFNDSDIAIDPRVNSLRITFKGDSADVLIRNITTGDEWQYNGVTTQADTVVLEGIRALKNGASIFRDTNRRLITLAPGWNDFEVLGASDFEISFDFRYYTI
jgi:phage-related protein